MSPTTTTHRDHANLTAITCLIVLLSTGPPSAVLSQWSSDVRLSSGTSSLFHCGARSIAAAGEILHVVWYDFRHGDSEVYYIASADGGATWSPQGRLTNSSGDSFRPQVWVSGPDVHVAWGDTRNGNWEIYYKRSTNGGFSWGPDVRLTTNSGRSWLPSISVAGQIVHVVWEEDRDGNKEIYYKASADGGVTWSPDARLTNNSAPSEFPSVWVSGPDVHVVWHDERHGQYEIYYKRSTNGGFSWGSDSRLTNHAGSSLVPSVSVAGQIVHVVWYDYRDVNFPRIYYKASADGGVTWSPDGRLAESQGSCPSVFVSGPDVHVVWYDDRDGNFEIYHRLSVNGGFSWKDETRVTNDPARSESPSFAVSGSKIHVVWSDDRVGHLNFQIYYKQNPNYLVTVSDQSWETPQGFSLSQNYPNPFNPETRFSYSLREAGHAQVAVFDVLGREVRVLVDEVQAAGVHEAVWDAKDKNGLPVSSGIYLYRLNAGTYIDVKKMVLTR